MFGFMRHHGPAQREWRMRYCGTCKTMGRLYGQRSRLLLNHDAVFLVELVDALTGVDAEQWSPAYRSWNCLRLPEEEEMPVLLHYVSAVNLLLSEYKVRDHETDSPQPRWRWARRCFSPAFRKAQRDLKALGFPLQQTTEILARQEELERNCGSDLEQVAGPTAEVTAIVFAHGARLAGLEEQSGQLAEIGRRFGRLIYLVDAWQDFDRDARSGEFNALRAAGRDPQWGAREIRESANAIDLPEHFRLRLRASVETALGPRLFAPRPRPTLKVRWREALVRTRGWRTPLVAFAIVAIMAFVFEREARLARSARECLSLGMNLMAFGGLLAMAAGPEGGKKGSVKSCIGSCCNGWSPDCDCCCDACCDGCCAAECCCSGCDC